MDREPFGVLAGTGRLPELVLDQLEERGRPVVLGLLGDREPPERDHGLRAVRPFAPEHFGDVPDFFLEQGVTDLVMAGSVDRSLLYDDERLDRADDVVQSNLNELDSHGDENLIETAVEVLEACGLTVRGIDEVLERYLSPEGHQAGPNPDEHQLETLESLKDVAVDLADREVGQTILGKRGSVVAVEAAEGTNRTIRRAGRYAESGLVMVKAARTGQDYRLDVPVVGESTVSELISVNAGMLAMEAGRTLWVQQDACRRLARENDLTIFGWQRS